MHRENRFEKLVRANFRFGRMCRGKFKTDYFAKAQDLYSKKSKNYFKGENSL